MSFLNIISKTQVRKQKLDTIKIKNICASKGTTKKWKDNLQNEIL